MQTVYIGNTLINDIFLGSQKIDDAYQVRTTIAEYLIVGAGGSGGQYATGNTRVGGGGGAGGLLSGSIVLNLQNGYTVQVGTGSAQLNGQNSTFISLTALGGGYGGNGGFGNGDGGNGGSGGGGAQSNTGVNGSAGTGSLGQGFSGANCIGTAANGRIAGGGGGAAQSGFTGSIALTKSGNGGNGKQSAIDGTLKYYAGGGAGGYNATGGLGGGGNSDTIGTDGLGGGGGGEGTSTFTYRRGGNGVVIVRYPQPQEFTGGTVTTDGSFIVHTFTSNGTLAPI
jgi:hypothetical protein